MARKLILALAVVAGLAVSGSRVLANSGGIPFYSGKDTVFCSQCHTGGVAPTVTLQGPRTLDIGMTGNFTLTVHSSRRNTQIGAGAGIAASGGQLSPGPGMQDIFGELAHSHPFENDTSDNAVFAFEWTAPTTSGTYTIFAAGNSVNLNDLLTGDAAAKTSLMVVVGKSSSPTATPTATPKPPTVTATSTTTPTQTASPSATRSPTLTPTGVLTATATIPGDTPTHTPTPSATTTPTRAVTPGDSNCNHRITAADIVPIVELTVGCEIGCGITDAVCGVDVNRDQQVDALDIDALIDLLF